MSSNRRRGDDVRHVVDEPPRHRRDIDPGDVVLRDHPPERTKVTPIRVFEAIRVFSVRRPHLRHSDDAEHSDGGGVGSVGVMSYVDVTDATFQTEVVDRSMTAPVVIDLWAPWCGPCKTLGPIIEKVVDDTDGKVLLAKVNVDENPAISQAFHVQGIPAVFAIRDGQVVDSFVGAYPEHEVKRFVEGLLPTEAESELSALVAKGDEDSLRQALELEPGNEDAIVALAELLVGRGDGDEALALLERIPESDRTRRVAAAARLGPAPPTTTTPRSSACCRG